MILPRVLLLATFFTTATCFGQDWSPLSVGVLEPDGSTDIHTGDRLGFSVDIDGEYAVAGAPYDDTVGDESGAAYVYKFNGTKWDHIAKLTPSDATDSDYFGWSVAISGNTIVVSALSADATNVNGTSSSGKVYIFEMPSSGWVSAHESAQLSRLDNTHGGYFGHKVDIFEDELVISHFDSGSSDDIALVYIYVREGAGWERKALLQPTTEIRYRQFGSSIFLTEKLLVVGAPTSEFFDGSVLLFEKPASGWVDAMQDAVLRPSDGKLNGYFGISIAMHDSTILVGSAQSYSGGGGAGYIFEKHGDWKDATEDALLFPEVKVDGANYGMAVGLGRDFAVMTSYEINSEGGSALFFRRVNGEWKNTSEYHQLAEAGPGDQFGYSLALDEDFLFIGATKAPSAAGSQTGAPLFFLKSPNVIEVNSSTPDGTYKVDDKVNIKVVFSQPVVIVGNLTLKISLKNNVKRDLLLKEITSEREFNFEYTVAQGDFSDDLDYQDADALYMEAGQIASTVNGVFASRTLPQPGSLYSLSGLRNLVIDGSVAVVGIEDRFNTELQPFPNPFSSGFQIEAEEDVSVVLITSNGSRIYESELRAHEICQPNVQQGIYILSITSKRGVEKRIKVVKH